MTIDGLPREIFRAYDIRGRADGEDAPLRPSLAEAIGRAFATHLAHIRHVVIGGDQRLTTPALMEAVIDGLLRSGVDVTEIGRAPSPLVYWATASQHQARPTAGIAITASHNPPEDNGVKLLEAGGMPLRPESIQRVADLIERGIASGTRRGRRTEWDPKPDYLQHLLDAHQLERPRRVAIDPGNGVASLTAGAALREIGAIVEAINDDPDDPQPSHPADPQHADHVAELAAFVGQTGAELGFAFDGDGDRLGLVDGRGRRARPDQVLALLAQDWLSTHPQAQVQIDVKTSQAVVEHIEALGGEAIFGPVGHSLGKYAMVERGIDFGGEASTHYYYRLSAPDHISDDAVRTACRIAQLASRNSLEPLLDAIPSYPISPEVKIACADDRKHALAAVITERASRVWPVNTIDGARVDLSGDVAGAWCVIRASNTTPFLTVVVEGRMDSEYEQARKICADLLSDVGLDPAPLLTQAPLD